MLSDLTGAVTVTCAGADVFPKESVAVTESVVPLGTCGLRAHVNSPVTGSAVVVHRVFPAGSVMITVEPGSAVPVTSTPSVGLSVGGAGGPASVSVTAVVAVAGVALRVKLTVEVNVDP